jgi:hypothetical protein
MSIGFRLQTTGNDFPNTWAQRQDNGLQWELLN